MVKTLAIETSCDDTSVSIVSSDGNSFSVDMITSFSQTVHQLYGGVVPELASREHSHQLFEMITSLSIDWEAIDFISVTAFPGLPGSLMVGTTCASFLGEFFHKPVYFVDHIFGHIFSVLIDRSLDDLPFPWVTLTASGGHNEIYQVNPSPMGLNVTKLGHTLDDASGEAFDKVARMLGGPYPGGAWVSEQAKKGSRNSEFYFKRIYRDSGDLDFSFSGYKQQAHTILAKLADGPSAEQVNDICYEFQESVVEVLGSKLLQAAFWQQAGSVCVVGGVSANDRLWEYVNQEGDFLYARPSKKLYSTDNAAMIGVVGILMHQGFVTKQRE